MAGQAKSIVWLFVRLLSILFSLTQAQEFPSRLRKRKDVDAKRNPGKDIECNRENVIEVGGRRDVPLLRVNTTSDIKFEREHVFREEDEELWGRVLLNDMSMSMDGYADADDTYEDLYASGSGDLPDVHDEDDFSGTGDSPDDKQEDTTRDAPPAMSSGPSLAPSYAPSVTDGLQEDTTRDAPSAVSPVPSLAPSGARSVTPSVSDGLYDLPDNVPSISPVPSSTPSDPANLFKMPSSMPSDPPNLLAVPSSRPSDAPSLPVVPSATPSEAPSLLEEPTETPTWAFAMAFSMSMGPPPTPSPTASLVPTIDRGDACSTSEAFPIDGTVTTRDGLITPAPNLTTSCGFSCRRVQGLGADSTTTAYGIVSGNFFTTKVKMCVVDCDPVGNGSNCAGVAVGVQESFALGAPFYNVNWDPYGTGRLHHSFRKTTGGPITSFSFAAPAYGCMWITIKRELDTVSIRNDYESPIDSCSECCDDSGCKENHPKDAFCEGALAPKFIDMGEEVHLTFGVGKSPSTTVGEFSQFELRGF